MKKNLEIVFLGRYKLLFKWFLYFLYEVIYFLFLCGCVVDGVVIFLEGWLILEGLEVGWVILIFVVGVICVMDRYKVVYLIVESEYRGKKWIFKFYFKKCEGLL